MNHGSVHLVASDLDDTFLTWPHDISATNAAAVREAADAGLPIIFATGRPLRWLEHITPILAAQPIVIVSNGAAVINVCTGEHLHSWALPMDVVAHVCHDLRAALPKVQFGIEYGTHFAAESGFERNAPVKELLQSSNLDVLLADPAPAMKLLVKHIGVPTDRLAELAGPIIDQRLTMTVSWMSDDGMLEIAAPGVSKRHALEVVAADLGIDPADIAAFGDMPNDLEMLQWVGHPHVMPNAHPSLLAAGLPVLTPPSEDAVGRKIREYVAAR